MKRSQCMKNHSVYTVEQLYSPQGRDSGQTKKGKLIARETRILKLNPEDWTQERQEEKPKHLRWSGQQTGQIFPPVLHAEGELTTLCPIFVYVCPCSHCQLACLPTPLCFSLPHSFCYFWCLPPCCFCILRALRYFCSPGYKLFHIVPFKFTWDH